MKIGTIDIDDVKIGTTDINEVRIGTDLIWARSLFYPQVVAYMAAIGVPYDATVYAPPFANNLTGIQLWNATQTLVADLDTNGILPKLKAFYPNIGGSAANCKWNLLNVADTDAAFRQTFTGGFTFDANGYAGNGTNGFVNTHFIPSVECSSVNEGLFGFYTRTNNGTNFRFIGCTSSGPTAHWYLFMSSSHGGGISLNLTTQVNLVPLTNSRCNIVKRGENTGMQYYLDGTLYNFTNFGTALPTTKFYFSARNNNGTAAEFTARNFACGFLGTGLTNAQAVTMTNIINAYMLSLGRNV